MTTKIAISLPDEQVDAAKSAVALGRAESVSGYISEAIARRQAEDDLAGLLAELDAEHGAVTAADLEWADKQLGIA